jgi:hypothetical protein
MQPIVVKDQMMGTMSLSQPSFYFSVLEHLL